MAIQPDPDFVWSMDFTSRNLLTARFSQSSGRHPADVKTGGSPQRRFFGFVTPKKEVTDSHPFRSPDGRVHELQKIVKDALQMKTLFQILRFDSFEAQTRPT